jgi:hypothetical protein
VTVDLAAVRVALTAALEAETFEGAPVRVSPWLADTWAPPCALVGAFSIQFEDTAYAGLPTALVTVKLVVGAQAQRPAQLALDELQTVYASALLADRTLGAVVTDVRPVRTTAVLVLRGSQELPAADCETLIVF